MTSADLAMWTTIIIVLALVVCFALALVNVRPGKHPAMIVLAIFTVATTVVTTSYMALFT